MSDQLARPDGDPAVTELLNNFAKRLRAEGLGAKDDAKEMLATLNYDELSAAQQIEYNVIAGYVARADREPEEALGYYQQGLALAAEHAISHRVVTFETNIAVIQSRQAEEPEVKLQAAESIIATYAKAKDLIEAGVDEGLADLQLAFIQCVLFIIDVYTHIDGKRDDAIQYIMDAQSMLNDLDVPVGLQYQVYDMSANLLLESNMPEEAGAYLDKVAEVLDRGELPSPYNTMYQMRRLEEKSRRNDILGMAQFLVEMMQFNQAEGNELDYEDECEVGTALARVAMALLEKSATGAAQENDHQALVYLQKYAAQFEETLKVVGTLSIGATEEDEG